MNVLFFINILMLPLSYIISILYMSRYWKLPIINPLTLAFAIFFPVLLLKIIFGPYILLEEGLLNKYYQYAILMDNIRQYCSLFLIIIYLHVLTKVHIKNFFPFICINREISISRMLVIEVVFFTTAVLLLLYVASREFGVVNWILSPRTGYQYFRDGFGSIYALSLTCASIAFSLGVLAVDKNSVRIIRFLLYLILLWFYGSKGFLINGFIFAAVFLWFFKFRYLNLFIVIFSWVVAIAMILNLSYAVDNVDLDKILAYFDYYYNSALYFEYFFNGGELFYGEIFFSELWGGIPRILYPEKPYVYGMLHINEIFYPGAAEMSHTPAFGGPVADFADFGLIGVIIGSLADFTVMYKVVMLNYIFMNDIKRKKNSIFYIIVFTILFSSNFLVFFPTVIKVFFFFSFYIILSLFSRLVIKK